MTFAARTGARRYFSANENERIRAHVMVELPHREARVLLECAEGARAWLVRLPAAVARRGVE